MLYLPNGFHSSWSNITLGVCLEEKVWGAPFCSFTQSLVHVSKETRDCCKVTSTNQSHEEAIILLQVSELTPQGAHLLEAVLAGAQSWWTWYEPRVNHCLPPPTQVTLALHIDTRICNTAFCLMPTAISLLMPYGEGSLCNNKTLNLTEKKGQIL